jgi:hypothetical protein
MTDGEPEKARFLRPVRSKASSEGGPLVLEYKKPKQRKRKGDVVGSAKFSPELRDLQLIGTDVVHATHKAAQALVKSIDTYERERLRSMKEKKDGALEDFVYNAGKAASVWNKETSDIALELSESVRRSEFQQRATERLRRVTKALRRWRM